MSAKPISPKLTPTGHTQTQRQILDLLADITRAAETAAYLAQEVQEEFFEAYRMDDDLDRCCACYEYDRHRVKMAVVLAAAEEVNHAIKAINVLAIAGHAEAQKKPSDEQIREQ